MKKFFAAMIITILAAVSCTVSAESGIIANVEVTDDVFTVSGEAGFEKEVTILVTSPAGAICYVDQAKSDATGHFAFMFLLPQGSANGEYTVKVGGEGINVPYQTTITYSGGLPPVRVNLNGEVITVDGNLQTGVGKDVTILVLSPLGDIVYVDQIANDVNGLYRFDFLLPPMSMNGVYSVNVGGEDIEVPYSGEFTYTNGTDVLSRMLEMKNIAPGVERKLFIQGENMRNLEHKTFILTYDPANLQVTDLCLFTYEKELQTGEIDGTHFNITEFNAQTGKIKFTLNVANGETAWNGTLAGILFEGRQNGNVTVQVDVITEM
ncbi:MAG: hypothetical protein IJN25_09715 [Clostridia bacterium]|nr:hypothetical protein [Clostridia bacterium]